MFITPPEPDRGLEDAIENVYQEMAGVTADSEEYPKMVDQLAKLYALKQKPMRVSPETLVAVGGQLLGILLILNHERLHPLTSKALSFVPRIR